MSFFKKIVDWFHDDVEEEVEVFDQEPRQQKTKNNGSRPQAGIENGIENGIETNIQYKYPKDNFKFPMISDEEIKRLNERKKMQKSEIRGSHSEYKEWTPVASALEEHSIPPVVKPLKKAVKRQKESGHVLKQKTALDSGAVFCLIQDSRLLLLFEGFDRLFAEFAVVPTCGIFTTVDVLHYAFAVRNAVLKLTRKSNALGVDKSSRTIG